MHAGAVIFGGMDVSNERNAVIFLGENAGFVGEPVVGVDESWLVIHEVFVNKIAIGFLNVADRNELVLMGGDDFF